MQNISEYIYEVLAVIFLCIGIGFFFLIYNDANIGVSVTRENTSKKDIIQEAYHGYSGDLKVSGATVYYDVKSYVDAYIQEDADGNIKVADNAPTIIVDGHTLSFSTMEAIAKGNGSALLRMIQVDSNYLKNYSQSTDTGEISSVSYTLIIENAAPAAGGEDDG